MPDSANPVDEKTAALRTEEARLRALTTPPDGDTADAWRRLCEDLIVVGALDDARAAATSAARIAEAAAHSDGMGAARLYLGQLELLAGRPAEAEQLFAQSVLLHRKTGSRLRLAYALLYRGKAIGALSRLEASATALQVLSALLAHLGRQKESEEARLQALALSPEQPESGPKSG